MIPTMIFRGVVRTGVGGGIGGAGIGATAGAPDGATTTAAAVPGAPRPPTPSVGAVEAGGISVALLAAV